MSTVLERLGISSPVVQAGLGGGLSRHELAAAVSKKLFHKEDSAP